MIYNLGDALKNLTWAEMDKVATHIANETNTRAQNGEEVDPHFVGNLLSELGGDIVKEAELEVEVMPRVMPTP